jgi:hypothetical protein
MDVLRDSDSRWDFLVSIHSIETLPNNTFVFIGCGPFSELQKWCVEQTPQRFRLFDFRTNRRFAFTGVIYKVDTDITSIDRLSFEVQILNKTPRRLH